MIAALPLRPYRKQDWERNKCSICGRFTTWEKLTLHFVPDTDYSSENESWRECDTCKAKP